MESLFLEEERKNKLLRSVAGGGVEQLVELRTRWDKFEIMMESQQPMIQDQVGRGGELPLGEELQADISQYEQMWTLYEEFSSRLEQLSEEDWISFRWDSPLSIDTSHRHFH